MGRLWVTHKFAGLAHGLPMSLKCLPMDHQSVAHGIVVVLLHGSSLGLARVTHGSPMGLRWVSPRSPGSFLENSHGSVTRGTPISVF